MTLFILHLVVYSFFTYLKDEGKEWVVVVVCKERQTIKKIKKNWYFNKMYSKIDSLMLGVLKNEYVE